MKTFELKAVKREGFGKKESKAVRREGNVPCIVYGDGQVMHLSVNAKEVKPLLYTANSYIVELDVEGEKVQTVMREVQYHPVKDDVLHIDFYRVQSGKPVAIDIPVKLVGSSEGVKLGGKLAQSKRKLRVCGMPENLPDELTVDVTELGIGKSIFVGDLKYDNLTLLTPATTAICAVRVTRASRGAATDDATTAAAAK